MNFIPTEQQLNCVTQAINNQHIVIEAVAGASKTTTLTLIAQAIVKPTIYLAFNKVTADEAATKFPPHVTCRTTHSIAFESCGMEISHKLKRPSTHYVNVAGTGSEIAKYYKIKPYFEGDKCVASSAALGMYVKQTVARYEQSASDVLSMEHISCEPKLPKHIKNDIVNTAKKLWKDRIDPSSKVLATHDTYLKMFQLTKPILEYSVVMVDEYQDSTACVIDIVSQQTHAKTIVVGDSFQSIYQWRGSTNGLSTSSGVVCKLSKSFRFGSAIAEVAQNILMYKAQVLGFEKIESVVDVLPEGVQHTYLFRTNTGLLTSAVDAIEQGLAVKLEIDVKDFISITKSVIALKQLDMKNVKHEKIIPYSEYSTLKEEAKQDGELGRLVALVESGRALRSIALLENYSNPQQYSVLFTTAHKSKGREWDYVVLADDFPSHYNKKGEWAGLSEMEQNLLYVAATRAKLCLQTNNSIKEVVYRLSRVELL